MTGESGERRLELPGLPAGRREHLYHFSEETGIALFRPRRSRPMPGHASGRDVVWAIDEHDAPLYFFLRECPRIVLWALESSSREDVERWLGGRGHRMVAFVEESWLPAMRSCEVYRYTFSGAPFENTGDHGTHVSAQPVRPLAVEPIGRLQARLARSGVDLRPVPSLQPLADAWKSSLHFSGIRLRNVREWRPPVEGPEQA